MVHLVYCDDKAKALDKIMNGSKIMIVRGAAGRKIPHSRVNEGEILYFMQKGSKKISAKAMVTHVDNYTKLTLFDSLNLPVFGSMSSNFIPDAPKLEHTRQLYQTYRFGDYRKTK